MFISPMLKELKNMPGSDEPFGGLWGLTPSSAVSGFMSSGDCGATRPPSRRPLSLSIAGDCEWLASGSAV